jgi:hypothetical protein
MILLGLCAFRVHADTIRGVNLGGWLLVEEWYVANSGRPRFSPMLTTQDHSLAISQHVCSR